MTGRRPVACPRDNGQLKKEIWKTTPTGTTVNTIEYTYNANGQMLTASDNAGTYTLTYTDFGELNTWTDVHGKVLDYDYDDAGRIDKLTYASGVVMTYGWANDNRLSSRSFDAGTPEFRVEYSYNDRDEVTEVRRYSDAAGSSLIGKTTYSRDYAGRLTSIHHKEADNDTIDHIQYVYNAASNVTQETSTNGPTRNYQYDVTNQLTGDGTGTWSYDLNGNRNSSGFTIGAGNRPSTDGTWNYAWDDEGNLSQKTNISSGVVWVYAWDHNNRLTKAERKPSSSGSVDLRVEYQFDVFGNRTKRTLDADGDGSGGSAVEKYAFDPDGNAWADLDSGGSLTTRRFYQDALDTVFARMAVSSGEEDWYLKDRLGSVRDILDDTGALINAIVFDSFGKLVSETSPSNGDRYKYAGFEVDPDTGLGIKWRRQYDFDLHRWLSNDPIGFAGGDTTLSRYVGNNPTNATDPTGLAPAGTPRVLRGLEGQPASAGARGTVVEIVSWSDDFAHRRGAGGSRVAPHYDVRFLNEDGKERLQRFHLDGTPFSEEENARLERTRDDARADRRARRESEARRRGGFITTAAVKLLGALVRRAGWVGVAIEVGRVLWPYIREDLRLLLLNIAAGVRGEFVDDLRFPADREGPTRPAPPPPSGPIVRPPRGSSVDITADEYAHLGELNRAYWNLLSRNHALSRQLQELRFLVRGAKDVVRWTTDHLATVTDPEDIIALSRWRDAADAGSAAYLDEMRNVAHQQSAVRASIEEAGRAYSAEYRRLGLDSATYVRVR